MALAFQSSLDQTTDGSAFNVGSGTNRVLYVGTLSRGNDVTGVTYNSVAMTKIEGITTNTVSAGDKYGLWVLANPTANSNTIQTSGGTGTIRITALALNGGDQTIPYNSGAIATQDSSTTAPHSCAVTTQYTGSWLVGFIPTATGGGGQPTGDSNTTFPNTNTYVMAYSPTIQTVGSNELGYTNSSAGVFLIAESVVSGGTKPSNTKGNFLAFM